MLVLDVRIDGFVEPVGQLVRDDSGGLSFAYSREQLVIVDAMPVSLSLPLREEPFGDVATRAFFDNLLTEQDGALNAVMAREGLSRSDVAGLLFHVGKDCAGALSVLPHGAPPTKVPGDLAGDYLQLGPLRLEQIVRSLYERRRLPDDMQDPSPLAGVQSKIAVTMLSDGSLAEPVPGSGAPTTHILKVPGRGHERDVDHELMSLEISRDLVATAGAAKVEYGGIPALLVERFDRRTEAGRVTRLHQEDFAQALGLPAALKYERRGVPGRRFDSVAAASVLNQTISPVAARARFLFGAVFDLLIGNTDAHAKNHALLHLGRGRVDLAPRYDLLPTRLDPNLTDELAFRIGEANRLQDIDLAEFNAFLAVLGITRSAAQRRMRSGLVLAIAEHLADSLETIDTAGQKSFADLIASNMRTLLPRLELAVPQAARDRDAAISRGGGWAAS